MNSQKSTIIAIAGVLGFVVLIIGGYLLFNKPRPKGEDLANFSRNAKKGEAGYEEKQTKFGISESRKSGEFVGFENDSIFLKAPNQKNLSGYLLAPEVAIQCTTQELSNVTEVDLAFVTKVITIKPSEITKFVPSGTPIFVMGLKEGEVVKVHTVLVNSSLCPEDTN